MLYYYLIVDLNKILSDFSSVDIFQNEIKQLRHELRKGFLRYELDKKIIERYIDYIGVSQKPYVFKDKKIAEKIKQSKVLFTGYAVSQIASSLPEHLKVIDLGF